MGEAHRGDRRLRARRSRGTAAERGISRLAWGENIGCGDYASARKSVLQSHLAFQREKSSNGGHWKNLKNPAYKKVGVGVWRSGGRTRLVIDFYRP